MVMSEAPLLMAAWMVVKLPVPVWLTVTEAAPQLQTNGTQSAATMEMIFFM